MPLTSVSIGIEGSLDHASARADGPDRRTGRTTNTSLDGGFLSRFEEHLRDMVHLTDGHYLCQCIVMPSLPVYRELGIEVLLRGHAGELMHMDKAYNFSLDREALAVRDEAELEEWLFGRLRAYMLGAIDGPALRRLPRRVAMRGAGARLAAGLPARVGRGIDPLIHRVWHLFISQRLRAGDGPVDGRVRLADGDPPALPG